MNREIIRMKPKVGGIISSPVTAKGGGGEVGSWEVRPGGMLVQKRSIDSNQNSLVVPSIKVRVKYGSFYHEISISSQASFGELKKMLAGPSGLHPQDQKLMYKEKERDSKAFLDVAGVKEGSKLVLIEDEVSRERRCLESRKTAKMEKASKDIAGIRLEVDKLAKQVAGIELDIHGGKKVMETGILNLIEALMRELIKLDGIDAEGDVKLQRRMQVKRVQKYIENLDVLKLRNTALGSNKIGIQQRIFTGETIHRRPIIQNQKKMQHHTTKIEAHNSPLPLPLPLPLQLPVVVTTKWETF